MGVTMVKIQKKKKSSFCIFLNFFLELTTRGNTDKRSPESYKRPLGKCPSKCSPGDACEICRTGSPTLDKLHDNLCGWGQAWQQVPRCSQKIPPFPVSAWCFPIKRWSLCPSPVVRTGSETAETNWIARKWCAVTSKRGINKAWLLWAAI